MGTRNELQHENRLLKIENDIRLAAYLAEIERNRRLRADVQRLEERVLFLVKRARARR